ncbi:hypothetical protein [Blastococcus sp. VKM Ac-2987]|uniref:hypothetical protein n=1 Tax=Blastococcus sp. VKM Ac-2987 TaxID=3004141 RepID=UPI0022AB82F8|nr:hypothetical protein [Blastococcus sp. VKM Ac-2987]MCZ2859185.1 hypothetical protein [Blastococcus sp. VKM Ac-2987]
MVPEIFIDFSLVGRDAGRVRSRVKASVRRRLQAGDTVVILGDDVAPIRAHVVTIASDSPEVEFELVRG